MKKIVRMARNPGAIESAATYHTATLGRSDAYRDEALRAIEILKKEQQRVSRKYIVGLQYRTRGGFRLPFFTYEERTKDTTRQRIVRTLQGVEKHLRSKKKMKDILPPPEYFEGDE